MPFSPSPSSLRRFLHSSDLPSWLSPDWRSCIASALACSASVGVTSAGADPLFSPPREVSARRHMRTPPRPQVARDRVAPVPVPRDRIRRYDDDDEFSDVDEAPSESESERWDPGLSDLLSFGLLWWPVVPWRLWPPQGVRGRPLFPLGPT